MILNYTKISCRDVLRGLWFSTKFSCYFFDFLLRALRLAYENQLRKLVHLPGRSAQQANRQVGNQRIQRTGRGAKGRKLHPAPLCCHKKRIEVSLDALLRFFAVCHVSCGSFFHNPAAALFFADFSQRRNPLRFGKSVCRSERFLRSDIASSGLCLYTTVRIALRDRSV